MSTSSTRIRLRIEQARADEQDAGEGDLRDDERVAHPARAAGPPVEPRLASLSALVSAGPGACSAGARPKTMPVTIATRQREDERGRVGAHVAQQRNADRVEPRQRARAGNRERRGRGARRCTRARCLR